MHSFYIPKNQISTSFFLSESDSFHLCKVLRAQLGEKIQILDGQGGFYEGEIQSLHSKKTSIFNVKKIKQQQEKSWKISLGIGFIKQKERLEWILEKAVEMDVDAIFILNSEFAQRKKPNLERWGNILIAAAKQSQNAYLPSLSYVENWQKLGEIEAKYKYIAHCQNLEKKPFLTAPKTGDIFVLIGPEGDFSMAEIQKAEKMGFVSVDLGTLRLRSETASLMVIFECVRGRNLIQNTAKSL